MVEQFEENEQEEHLDMNEKDLSGEWFEKHLAQFKQHIEALEESEIKEQLLAEFDKLTNLEELKKEASRLEITAHLDKLVEQLPEDELAQIKEHIETLKQDIATELDALSQEAKDQQVAIEAAQAKKKIATRYQTTAQKTRADGDRGYRDIVSKWLEALFQPLGRLLQKYDL